MTAVCSPANLELVRSLGADHVVDYTREDFTRGDAYSDTHSETRYDLMLDIAGSRSFGSVRRVLTPRATIVVVGAKMTGKGLGPIKHIFGMRLASVGRGQTVRLFTADVTREDLSILGELLAAGTVRSVIERRFELDRVVDALNHLGEGHARGKIVVTV